MKNQTILSIKNLAAFTKDRSDLKVIGTPNLNATKTKTESALSRISKNTRSVFSKDRRYQISENKSKKSHRSRPGSTVTGAVEDYMSSPNRMRVR